MQIIYYMQKKKGKKEGRRWNMMDVNDDLNRRVRMKGWLSSHVGRHAKTYKSISVERERKRDLVATDWREIKGNYRIYRPFWTMSLPQSIGSRFTSSLSLKQTKFTFSDHNTLFWFIFFTFLSTNLSGKCLFRPFSCITLPPIFDLLPVLLLSDVNLSHDFCQKGHLGCHF